MQRLLSHLWYDDDAEAAVGRYVELIPGSRIDAITRFPRAGHEVHGRPEGSVMNVAFRLGDTDLVALNGGPHFRFTPAISLFVTLETEAEVDRLWDGLADGGSVLMPLDAYDWSRRYGWVADRWGLTWQVCLGSHADVGRTVSPCLMFTDARAGQAGAALDAYTALFPDARIDGILRDDGAADAGLVKHAQARLGGATVMVMDSPDGHGFGFNEAVSLMVLCEDQAEIDRLWSALSAVPEAEACGWLKDRFGVSWQIVPRALGAMMTAGDRDQVERVTAAFMAMKKLDLPALERACAG